MAEKNNEKTEFSWVYGLRKKDLMKECEDRGLKTKGTVDTLRTRLVDYLKMQKRTTVSFIRGSSLIQQPPPSALSMEHTRTLEPSMQISRRNSDCISVTAEDCTTTSTTSPCTTTIRTSPCTTTSMNYYDILTTQMVITTTSSTTTPQSVPPTYTTAALPHPIPYIPPVCGEQKHVPENKIQTNGIASCDIVDKVRKWNVKFDQGQDPLNFIERVEELAERYEISVDRLVRALPELLTRNALIWYRNNKNNWKTWNEFIKEFKNFFLPPRFHIKLSDDIRARIQKPGEKARDYITAIQSMQRWQEFGSKE